MNVLILLAHHDDECFVSVRIRREVAAGNRVLVAFTTCGSAYGTSRDVREAESFKALARLGIAMTDVFLLGRELDIEDGQAGAGCGAILTRCREIARQVAIERIVTVAWEGGHPDHDITHLVARRLALEWHIEDELLEFPLYTASGAPPRLYRVGRFNDRRGEAQDTRMTLGERVSAVTLVSCFPSQWRSWVGLLPEAAVRYLVFGRQQLRKVHPREVAGVGRPRRPHTGPLFYERRFRTTFECLLDQARPLLDDDGSARPEGHRQEA